MTERSWLERPLLFQNCIKSWLLSFRATATIALRLAI